MTPVVSITGMDKKSKTDLVEALVGELSAAGYRVGVIKHHVHGDFDMDVPGKPTFRHRHAGATHVAISSPTMFAVIRRETAERDLMDIVDDFFGDVDVVLTEGYQSADTFKIEATPEADVKRIAEDIRRRVLPR